MVLNKDLLGEAGDVVVADNWGIEPALAAVYKDEPTIVDVVDPELEDELFQANPAADISVRVIGGEKVYVSSSPAGPVTVSGSEAYARLTQAKDFDKGVKSRNLSSIRSAQMIAEEHFPDYTNIAKTRYKQRVVECLDKDTKMSVSEEAELVDHFKDSGVFIVHDGNKKHYMQQTGAGIGGLTQDHAMETLRAYANFRYILRNERNADALQCAKDLASTYFSHLEHIADRAIDNRIQNTTDELFWQENFNSPAQNQGMSQYVIRN